MLGIYFMVATAAAAWTTCFTTATGPTWTTSLRANGSDWAYTLMRDGLSRHLPQDNVHIDHQGIPAEYRFRQWRVHGHSQHPPRVDEEFVEENHGVAGGMLTSSPMTASWRRATTSVLGHGRPVQRVLGCAG